MNIIWHRLYNRPICLGAHFNRYNYSSSAGFGMCITNYKSINKGSLDLLLIFILTVQLSMLNKTDSVPNRQRESYEMCLVDS